MKFCANRFANFPQNTKSQSRPLIAGSSRNVSKHSLGGAVVGGKDTDCVAKDRKVQPCCQTLNSYEAQKPGVNVSGLNSVRERGLTLTAAKVPKFLLSQEGCLRPKTEGR